VEQSHRRRERQLQTADRIHDRSAHTAQKGVRNNATVDGIATIAVG
jgi:hypothetical protein